MHPASEWPEYSLFRELSPKNQGSQKLQTLHLWTQMRTKGKNGCDVWNPRSAAGTTKPETAQDQLVQKHYEGAATQDDRAVQHSPIINI